MSILHPPSTNPVPSSSEAVEDLAKRYGLEPAEAAALVQEYGRDPSEMAAAAAKLRLRLT